MNDSKIYWLRHANRSILFDLNCDIDRLKFRIEYWICLYTRGPI